VFLEIPRVPVHVGVLWPTREEAQGCPTGTVALAFCPRCGFIGNRAFDPGLVDYTLSYDNSLGFSPFFQDYERRLADRLIDTYQIRGKDVVEIGCGQGHFLGLVCELGGNRGYGFDPSHDPAHAGIQVGSLVTVVREHYSERYADRPADLLCCRHVLEHLPDPRDLIRMLRRALDAQPGSVVYFEVPNALLFLRELSIWDIIYEHCGYFSAESLGNLFRSCGFEVLALGEDYQGQFVSIEARPGANRSGADVGPTPDVSGLARDVSAFSEQFLRKKREWRERLAALGGDGTRAVVWGGGAKGVSFLNLLELGDAIEWVVDVNPRKQGTYLAGSGQKIVAPEFLKEVAPDIVVVMNPIYKVEIEEELRSLGLSPQVVTV
jgi:SAM-dependent methyltransferase